MRRGGDPVGETATVHEPPLGPRRGVRPEPDTTPVATPMAARKKKVTPRPPDPRDTPATLQVVHPDAAGIDVHSDMHMVCVPRPARIAVRPG